MIFLDAVTVSLPYGKPQPNTILKNITISINTGEKVAVVGRNGSGKTTLLQTIAGLIPPVSGTVSFSRFGKQADRESPKPSFALVLQDPDNQFVASSVLNELILSAGRSVESRGNRDGVIHEAVDRFKLKTFLDRNPHRLSYGEKQRLAFATVWLADPEILLLDEPATYLDARFCKRFFEFIDVLNSNGTTIVWATPGGDDLMRVERVIWIEDGEVRFDGACDAFFTQVTEPPSPFVPPKLMAISSSLFGDNEICDRKHLPKAVNGGWTAGMSGNSGIQVIAKRLVQLSDLRTKRTLSPLDGVQSVKTGDGVRSQSEAADVVAFEDVSFAYGSCEAIHQLTFRIYQGQCTGISGPNGSGKSTLLSLASGVLEPVSGRVRRLYERAFGSSGLNVFHLFQSPERMFFAETVYDELAFGINRVRKAKQNRDDSISQALTEAGLDPVTVLDRPPMNLSFGEMRRLAFAVFLSLKPKFLLLDEPTACLDMAGRKVLYRILVRFLSEGGSVLVASHDVDFLFDVCGRLIYLDGGRIQADVDISSGSLPENAFWPGEAKPVIIDVQDAMASMGVDVIPRAVSADRLVDRLTYSSQTRNPT